jgi:uncharacterized protein (DUF305 family)
MRGLFYKTRDRVLLLLSISLLLTSCGSSSQTPVSPSGSGEDGGAALVAAGGPASSTRVGNFEVRFMTMMIDHHAMAVEMSRMCLDKATRSELRGLCGRMMSAQAAEIETMRSWLQAWYGLDHAPRPMDGGEMAKLAVLEGEAFEIAFMKTMSRHHRTAVIEGQKCTERAEHAMLRALCEEMVATQKREIQQMETWLCLWYRVWCSKAELEGAES